MREDVSMGPIKELDGRVFAIAGVGGGLGPLVAGRLASAGATVAGTDRDQGRIDEVGSELWLPAERWDGRAVDLLDEDAGRGWCADLLERFGRVDGLLHLVGGWRGGQPLRDAPLADWDLLHDLLIRTVQHTSRAFHDALLAAPHGRFVLVSAKQAQAPSNSNAAYAAAKAAAEAWTLALADGFAGSTSATANIVVVDAILTPRMREENPDGDFAAFTPAEHIAEAIAFLCSDAADEMNGQRLPLTA
jgi:NAD(P)-dependent dehydrogenase (short-subunit alcohol dehydrogenase family)